MFGHVIKVGHWEAMLACCIKCSTCLFFFPVSRFIINDDDNTNNNMFNLYSTFSKLKDATIKCTVQFQHYPKSYRTLR